MEEEIGSRKGNCRWYVDYANLQMQLLCSGIGSTAPALPYSSLQNPVWLQRSAMAGEMDFSNVGVESIKYEAVYSSFVILPWCSFLVGPEHPI